MRRVLIGTPCYDWRMDAAFAFSLTSTVRMGMERGIEIRELYPSGIAILPHVRNELIRVAVEFGYDDLIYIDNDEDFEPEWVFQLLNHPVDVVGIAVPRKDDIEQYNVRTPQGALSMVVDKVTGLWTAPGMTIGTGFLRVSRKALLALWESGEPYKCHASEDVHHWIFDHRPMDVGKGMKVLVSEDNFLGDKLIELGFQTWVDPRMTCGHYGRKRYSGNFAEALGRFQAYERSLEERRKEGPEAPLPENVMLFKAPAGADEDAGAADEPGHSVA